MLINIFLFLILMMAFAMVAAKRLTALIDGFRAQSFFLFLLMFVLAYRAGSTELYVVAALLLSFFFTFVACIIGDGLHRTDNNITNNIGYIRDFIGVGTC